MRLHEKGGKHHEMLCQQNLKIWLKGYIDAAGIDKDKIAPLFRSIDRKTKELGYRRLDRRRAWEMAKRHARQAGIETPGVRSHTFRGTGIPAYL